MIVVFSCICCREEVPGHQQSRGHPIVSKVQLSIVFITQSIANRKRKASLPHLFAQKWILGRLKELRRLQSDLRKVEPKHYNRNDLSHWVYSSATTNNCCKTTLFRYHVCFKQNTSTTNKAYLQVVILDIHIVGTPGSLNYW